MPAHSVERVLEAVWRMESARIIACVARIVRDLGTAEELAQEALLAALQQWPTAGIPENPGAWLTSTAQRRAVDFIRKRKTSERHQPELGRAHDQRQLAGEWDHIEQKLDDEIGDDVLRLIYMTCHPVLPPESRVALTLRLVAGLSAEEIARAYLQPLPTIAQRLTRAKRTLQESGVEFGTPRGEELEDRRQSVLEVIYLLFNEGYAATSGTDWMRPHLCNEALRLGRRIAELLPQHAETWGLIALMELQASRLPARCTPQGEPVLLLDQNRARWDHLLIRRGLAALNRANAIGERGPYVLQAELAACHARARTAEATDWRRIVSLYEELTQITPSPIVELNRAVAVGMAEGPAAALPLVDALAAETHLANYHLLPSVRGDLLEKLGKSEQAAAEFTRAAQLAKNERERTLLMRRADACAQRPAFNPSEK